MCACVCGSVRACVCTGGVLSTRSRSLSLYLLSLPSTLRFTAHSFSLSFSVSQLPSHHVCCFCLHIPPSWPARLHQRPSKILICSVAADKGPALLLFFSPSSDETSELGEVIGRLGLRRDCLWFHKMPINSHLQTKQTAMDNTIQKNTSLTTRTKKLDLFVISRLIK